MLESKRNLTCQMPLFPLPLVLLPGEFLPLHIFEPRYQMMLQDVTEGHNRFGVVLNESHKGGFAEVGCMAEIKMVEKLSDGRAHVFTLGSRRFKVIDITQEKPYLIAEVEALSDPEPTRASKVYANKVRTLLDDIFKLSGKLSDGSVVELPEVPKDPTGVCYWVAQMFYRSAEARQEVLESTSLLERLTEQYLWLDEQRRYLAAKAALKDALS